MLGYRAVLVVLVSLWVGGLAGCDSEKKNPPEVSGAGSEMPDSETPGSEMPGAEMPGDEPDAPEVAGGEGTCAEAWAGVDTLYPDAGELGSCDDVAGGPLVANSIMDLEGVTIRNNGETMTPCVGVRCDEQYAYIATNALPHYDFVATTPNPLVENRVVYRIPLNPRFMSAPASADRPEELRGCEDAFEGWVNESATPREPAGLCLWRGDAQEYLVDGVGGEEVYARKIACLGTSAFTIGGVPIFGPNEAATPDPYGNPLFNMPSSYDEGFDDTNGAVLDLCGGHTANVMHYHGVNEACFALDDAQKPDRSYAIATQTWVLDELLNGECTQESGIVGWNLDGFPIKGPCVCMERAEDGTCARIERVQSGWHYQGISAWGDPADAGTRLAREGELCDTDNECCDGGNCRLKCAHASVEREVGAQKRCVAIDYSWCTHKFTDRSEESAATEGVTFLDRCNGVESADGYAYHATFTFPYVPACYRGEPSDTVQHQGYVDDNMMDGNGDPMGGGGGNQPPKCEDIGQTERCCGDNFCGGPENADNCPEDCA